MPKIVYGLVDADWPTIPFSIKPGEAKELPEDEKGELTDDARVILGSGYVSEQDPLAIQEEEVAKNRPLSKSEEKRLNANKNLPDGEEIVQ